MEKGDEVKKGRMKEEASGSGGGAAGVKRKKVYNVEPRTPLKRQRIPVARFQSPVTEEATPKPKPVKEEIVILYKKSTFLAVRGAENTFYLCKTQQNVNSGSRQFRIQWLNLDQPPNIYKMDYIDHTDIECVLTNVRMERIARDTFRLPHSEQERAEKILQKAMKAERGEPIEDEEEEEAAEDMDVKEEKDDPDEEEEDDGEWEDEPTPKKRNTSKGKGKGNKPLKIALTKGKKSKQSSGQKKKDKDSKKKEKKKVEKKKVEKKRGPDRKLRPNPKIKVQEKNLFFETKENVPFTSVTVKTRQVLRAAILEDKDLLKSLMESDSVYKIDVVQSIQNHMTAVDYAIERGNKEMLQLLLDDIFENSKARIKRVTPTKCILGTTDTGHYNQYYLGVRRIRALNVSRGSREGNDAFTKDVTDEMNCDYVLESLLKRNADPSFVDLIINKNCVGDRESTLSTLYENIYRAVELGHRKIAARLATDAEKSGGYGFNFLHAEVLRFEKEDLRTNLLAASVRKKPYANIGITPLHCAAINPNVKYISRLLQVEPDINLMDKKRRRPIHYAAACEGSGPLELLLERGASPDEVDTTGVTPLHFACSAGRAQNVDVLLKKAKTAADALGDMGTSKWGIGGINRSDRFSVCPIHAAIFNGHTDVVKTLIKHGANLNKQLSAGKDKKSPLMLAAEKGYLGIARLLVQNGATVELLDKFKRTALSHAVMNGNSNVASYLLYLGADPNRVDSSGNTLVHYAAAYGWPFCLKMLINDADADPSQPNDWKTTPIAVAFMKGHMGLVDYLLNRPGVDINFKDDEGMTLTTLAVRSQLDKSLVSQVEYLVKEKKADPSIPDLNGWNSLHHLAANSIKVGRSYYNTDVSEEAMDTSVMIAKLLIAGGCDPAVETEDGKTPVFLAIQQLNSKLVRFLVENGSSLSPKMIDNENVLHMMAKQCMSTDLAPLIEILADQKVAAPKKLSKKVSLTSSKHDEAMEVDEPPGVEINNKVPEVNESKMANINGEEEGKNASKKVDEVERMNGDIGDEPMEEVAEESVLKIMAAAVDGEGMTPFLRACNEYRNFRARYMNQAEQEKVYQQARDFIRALIDLGGSDINKCIFVKDSQDRQKVKTTAIHMMLETQSEPQVCRDGQVITSPGLALLLRYKPNLEVKIESNTSPLYMAIEAGASDKVTMLIKHGADVNAACNINGRELIPPIICAAMNGSREGILRLLIDAKANVNARHGTSQNTPLHYVVQRRSNEEIIDKLLKAGADLNARNGGKYTPFHLLVSSHSGDSDVSLDLEEFLIDKGADVFAKDENGRLPLHYAFTKLSGATSGADPIELCSLLTTVMKDMNADDIDSCGRSPLHYAAQRGATICCMHLLQRRAEISRKDIHGNTPLSLAVKHKHDSCAIMLIQRGASVRERIVFPAAKTTDHLPTSDNDKKKKPEYKWRPLSQWEAKPSPPKAISYPVYQGALRGSLPGLAHIIIENTGTDFSAVECALSEGKCNIALRLMKRIPDPSRLQAINEDGQNLFHILVFKVRLCSDIDSVLKVAQMLRDKGVPVGLRDKFGRTPLQYAAIHHENKALAKFLIDNDPALDLKMKDKLGRDVLCAYMWDVEHVDVGWLEMLINKGASLNVRFDRPVPDSILFGSLVIDSSPDYFTMKGDIMITPVILAIHYREFSLLKFMLSKGASPSFDDSLRRSPLMHAVVLNDVASVKLLLNHSYDPNEKPQEEAVSAPTPALQKRLSRALFMLRPDGSISHKSDIITEESTPEEKKSEKDLDAKDKTEEDVENDKSDEDDDGQEDGEDDDEEEEVPEEDSDHDTDVMEDEEEEEKDKPEKQTSILSKQLSLKKGPSKHLSIDAYPTVDKTSSVDVDAVDNQGWTVLHHLVSPLEFGTYDDEAVLVQLARGGAILDKKDNAGLSALDYALIRGAPKIGSRLQKLLKVEKVEKPTFSSFEMGESMLKDGTKVDFRTDCEKMMEKLHEDENDGDANKIVYEVDSYCKDSSSSELVRDTSQDIPYDVLLSKVDVSCGTYGMYNFYKMQLTFEKNKEIYVLFTRWGRIGDRGQYQHTPYQKKEEAVKEYCKIFRTKTGNDWSKVGSYVNHPKKYRLVHRERKYAKVKKVDLSLTSDLPCKLPQDLQDVVKEMSSDKMLQASLSRIGMNVDYMPFGHIKKDCLLEAKNILTQLGELIEMVNAKGTSLATTDPEQYEANYEKISKLSNDYYHLVPSHGFEYEAIRPITNMSGVKEKLRFLFNILDIEIASRILIGSQMRLKDMTPLDYIYRSVNCQIESLPPDSIEAQYILGYIQSTDHRVYVRGIYKLARPGEEERLKALNMENHRLLWHGSSMSNFLSILHRGLLIAPPEAPISGHLFGEGIYFSDSFKKSRNYCSNHNPDSYAQLLLLSQVALGKCKETTGVDADDMLDPDINSLKVYGQEEPDPDYDVFLPYGAVMPMGRMTSVQHEKTVYMPYNEYVIFNPSQICLRYLVLVSNQRQ